MNEFELINHFFADQQAVQRQDVIHGIGDDCAVLTVPAGQQLLVSMDTLVSGVHFPVATQPYDIAYKALAVNLSDLAAMGANPAWISLALTMPCADKAWLAAFSQGLFALAKQFEVALIGGDTTRGPLSITIQAHGFVPEGQAVLRHGAQPGDLIYVTNTLGDAGLALKYLQKEQQVQEALLSPLLAQLNRPFPRVKEGLLLRNYASAMIDLSDGLIADLLHIMKKSGVGALIHVEQLPLSHALRQSVTAAEALQLALSAGDDYELCFTLPAHKKEELEQLMNKAHSAISCIGQITAPQQLELLYNNKPFNPQSWQGYTHF